MGPSASKRVKTSLSNSAEFDSACAATFQHCRSLTQNAYEGVFPYQLCTAADHLHHILAILQPYPLIVKWVSSPPTRAQVDSALGVVRRSRPSDSDREDGTIGPAQFKSWAIELFAEAVVSNVGKEVIFRVPIGIAGITGLGAVTRSGKDLVGAAVAIYGLGVATTIYFSLSS